MDENKNTLLKSILTALRKRLKPGHIIFLAVLLSANAFAWFIYMDKISSSIDVKVKSWNVSFKFDNQQMIDYINFSIDEMYPGMTPYKESLSVTNDGEMSARLTYEIVSLKVFDDFYTTEDGSYTEDELVNIMKYNYPFQISVTTNKETIAANGGTAIFYINATWPYESVNTNGQSNDTADTYWGNKAYEFKKNNSTKPCISVKVMLSAIQIES